MTQAAELICSSLDAQAIQPNISPNITFSSHQHIPYSSQFEIQPNPILRQQVKALRPSSSGRRIRYLGLHME